MPLQPDLIRAPNHLGDFIMALPALAAAPAADVALPAWLLPVARLLRRDGSLVGLERGTAGLARSVARLRSRRYGYGALLTPSFSSALMLRLAGVARIRGLPRNRRTALLHEVVPLRRTAQHRTELYLELVTGVIPARLPVPRIVLDEDALAARRVELGGGGRPLVAVFPGSNAPARRWPWERYAGLTARLAARGARVVVLGSAAEAGITARVAAAGGLDLGGRTALDVLAVTLGACDILVTNDSGPMHLAAAAGTRTLVVSGPADVSRTGPRGADHTYLQRLDLPCVPCVKNHCPRRGAGTILPEAEQECLRLIEVEEVVAAASRMLAL